MSLPASTGLNRISWAKILSSEGIFERVPPFRNFSSHKRGLYPLSIYALITLVILLVIAIHKKYHIWRSIIIFWGVVIFPAVEIFYRDSLKAPFRSCLCAIHMGVFIEVSYIWHIWVYEGKIIFTTVVSMLRLLFGGDGIFPITMCTTSILQCWAHGESKLIAILFTYFFILLIFFFNRIMKRLRLRFRNALQQLITTKKKILVEKHLVDSVISNSAGWKYWNEGTNGVGPSSGSTGSLFPKPESSIMQACEGAKLLSSISDIKHRLNHMVSWRHMKRTACTLIAIKPIFGGSPDCQGVSLQSANIWRTLQALSAHYSVVLVRRFGDVWIGCAGLLDTDISRSPEVHAQHVLQMACDLVNIGHSQHMRFTCAIDTGKVVGGFLNGIFNFDMFGPEILWALAVCETYNTPSVVVSRSCRKMILRSCAGVVFKNIVIYLPDRKDPERPSIVSNVESCRIIYPPFSASHSSSAPDMSFPWHIPLETMRQNSFRPNESPDSRQAMKTEKDATDALWKTAPYMVSMLRKIVKDINPNVSSWEIQNQTDDDGTNSKMDMENEAFLIEALHSIMFRRVLVDSWMLLRIPSYFMPEPSTTDQTDANLDQSHETLWSPPIPYTQKFEYCVSLYSRLCATFLFDMTSRFGFINKDTHGIYKINSMCDDNCSHCTSEHAYTDPQALSNPPAAGTEFHPLLSWEEYNRSCRSLIKRIADNLGALVMAVIGVIAWVQYQTEFRDYYVDGPYRYPIAFSIASSLCSAIIFENRDYPLVVHLFMNILRCAAFISLTIQHDEADNNHMLETVMVMLLGFIGWIYMSFGRRVVYFITDSICALAVMSIFTVSTDSNLMKPKAPQTIGSIGIALGLVAFLFWLCEYVTCLGYLLEHILLPEELKVYEYYKETSCELMRKLIPDANEQLGMTDFAPRCHRNCAILSFHIKAAESIPAVVDISDVSSFISFMYEFLDECVVKFGLQSVHISAICEEAVFSHSSKSSTIPYIQRAVECVRYIQKKLTQFNNQKNMNITLGVSLSHGSATIGVMGDVDNLRYDITGSARDKGFYMCLKQSNGVVVSAAFQDEINRLSEISDSTYSLINSKLPFGRGVGNQWFNLTLDGGSFGASARQIEDYTYEGFLGQGGNGSVHLLCDQVNQVKVAIKGIKWQMGRTSSIPHIRRELVILQQLHHPNVVNFKFCIIKREKIYIVMEYIRGGTLRQIIDQTQPSNEDLRVWFAQLVLALEYLHHQGIMHRDVKPSNCMIDTFGHLKLTDFGLALKEEIRELKPSDAMKSQSHLNSIDQFTIYDVTRTPKHLTLSGASEKLIQNMFPIREDHDLNRDSNLKGSILILDSDKVRQQINASVLRQSFVVWNANNDDEAIDLVDTQHVDLIILNLNLNEDTTSGWGFLSVLWSDETGKRIPVIVLTLSTELISNTDYWQKRLPGITNRPKQIFQHTIDLDAHRNYFAMLCRTKVSESDPSNQDKASQATVFDKLFDGLYRMKTLRAEVQRESMRVSVPARRLVKAKGLVGTMQYMSPEMIADEPYFEVVDWWSCGVLFFECITRKRLFDGNGNNEIAKSIMTCDIPAVIAENKEVLGPHLSDLLLHMLDRVVSRRYDSRLIKRHSYFNTVEPYMVGKRFPPASVDRTSASRAQRDTLPSLNTTSFRDLCVQSSEYRPQPIPPDKLSAELKESLKQDFYSSGGTKTKPSSSSLKLRSMSLSKKDNSSRSGYSFMPKLEEDSDEESDEEGEQEGKLVTPSFK